MDTWQFRLAEMDDLPRLLEIYAAARAFMVRTGNTTQWADGRPHEAQLRQDIAKRQLYVGESNGEIHGALAFIQGEDPTYAVIEHGAWRSDAPYGTLHRVASDGFAHGMMPAAVAFCAAMQPHLRIDTHEENAPMRRQIARCGFEYCGIIHIADGSPRMAFERLPGKSPAGDAAV